MVDYIEEFLLVRQDEHVRGVVVDKNAVIDTLGVGHL
jgi:hypothetical protein